MAFHILIWGAKPTNAPCVDGIAHAAMRDPTMLTENHAVTVVSIGSLWIPALWAPIHNYKVTFIKRMVALHS